MKKFLKELIIGSLAVICFLGLSTESQAGAGVDATKNYALGASTVLYNETTNLSIEEKKSMTHVSGGVVVDKSYSIPQSGIYEFKYAVNIIEGSYTSGAKLYVIHDINNPTVTSEELIGAWTNEVKSTRCYLSAGTIYLREVINEEYSSITTTTISKVDPCPPYEVQSAVTLDTFPNEELIQVEADKLFNVAIKDEAYTYLILPLSFDSQVKLTTTGVITFYGDADYNYKRAGITYYDDKHVLSSDGVIKNSKYCIIALKGAARYNQCTISVTPLSQPTSSPVVQQAQPSKIKVPTAVVSISKNRKKLTFVHSMKGVKITFKYKGKAYKCTTKKNGKCTVKLKKVLSNRHKKIKVTLSAKGYLKNTMYIV